MYRKNIPMTDSIQELAHFWNTHDLTDFEEVKNRYEMDPIKSIYHDGKTCYF